MLRSTQVLQPTVSVMNGSAEKGHWLGCLYHCTKAACVAKAAMTSEPIEVLLNIWAAEFYDVDSVAEEKSRNESGRGSLR